MVLLSKRKKGSLLHKMQPCVKMLGLLNLRIKNDDLMGSSKNEESYRLAGLVESDAGSLRWEFPAVNRQPFDWECGFYVMKWMHDFVLKYQKDNFPNIVPWSDERLLENKELNAWCAWFTLWRD